MGIMRILAILLFVIGVNFVGFSQEIGEETREGKTYKVHVVEAGNTLYGLHIKYGVAIEDIVKANPTVTDGLKVGQKLYIPFDKTKEKEEVTAIHIVKKKETLYGISRQYKCSVDELIRLNPGVEDGLDIGQELRIPLDKDAAPLVVKGPDHWKEPKEEKPKEEETVKVETDGPTKEEVKDVEETLLEDDETADVNYKIEFTDSIIEYEVQRGETLYSISRRFMVPVEKLVADNNIKGNSIQPGQILKIQLKQERISEVDAPDVGAAENLENWERPNLIALKDKYKVLVALPMRLNQNSRVLSGTYDDKTELNSLTELSVSFLMGAQMAIDSLEKLGLNADVEFFDTDGDLNKFKDYLGATNLKKFDMLIGPFYPKLMEYAATWAKDNKVPVIAVTKIPTKLLEENPYVVSTVPSDLTLIGGMAKYLAQVENANIIVIEGENEVAKKNVSYFGNTFAKYANGKTLKSSTASGLAGFMDPNKENYFVCLTDNVQQVMKFTNALNAAKNTNSNTKKAKVSMVGLSEWKDITALTAYYRNRFELHYASSNHLDYSDSLSNEFTKKFRTRYSSDPTKYAFHGFDVVLSQLSYLLLGFDRSKGLMDEFYLKPVGPRHGSENSAVFISKQADFENVLLKVVRLD